MTRLAIIVPYRERRQHLDQFVPHMRAYFARDKLDKDVDYRVLIVEQEANAKRAEVLAASAAPTGYRRA